MLYRSLKSNDYAVTAVHPVSGWYYFPPREQFCSCSVQSFIIIKVLRRLSGDVLLQGEAWRGTGLAVQIQTRPQWSIQGPWTGHSATQLRVVGWTHLVAPQHLGAFSISHSSSVTVFLLLLMQNIIPWQHSEKHNQNKKATILGQPTGPSSILPPAVSSKGPYGKSLRIRVNTNWYLPRHGFSRGFLHQGLHPDSHVSSPLVDVHNYMYCLISF